MHGANRQNNLHVFIYPNAQIYLFGTDGLLGCSLYIHSMCELKRWHTQNYKYEGTYITDRLTFR